MRTSRTRASGAILQSGINYAPVDDADSQYLVRGVVIATYVADDPQHPMLKRGLPQAIYCDVVSYSNLPGSRATLLSQVLVRQEMGGMHRGWLYKPRAAKGMVDGSPVNYGDPRRLDGDHVLIGFIDRMRTQPVILGALPHPYADKGAVTGRGVKLKLVDGDPILLQHHGCTLGVTDAGDITIDASNGNRGLVVAGVEQPHVPGQGGNVNVTTATGALLTVADGIGTTLQAHGSGATAAIGIGCAVGTGTQHLVVAEKLLAYLASIVTWANTHTHLATGPTAPTATGLPALTTPDDIATTAISII